MLPLSDGVKARHFPAANITIANFAVWLFYELPDLRSAVTHASFHPCAVDNACHAPEPWGISWITAMFLHGSWDHILGNMLFLAIFGKNVEDAFGSLGYLVFYFAGGFVAMMTQTAMTLLFGSAADAQVPNLGASGAIAAVLGAYFVLYPDSRRRDDRLRPTHLRLSGAAGHAADRDHRPAAGRRLGSSRSASCWATPTRQRARRASHGAGGGVANGDAAADTGQAAGRRSTGQPRAGMPSRPNDGAGCGSQFEATTTACGRPSESRDRRIGATRWLLWPGENLRESDEHVVPPLDSGGSQDAQLPDGRRQQAGPPGAPCQGGLARERDQQVLWDTNVAYRSDLLVVADRALSDVDGLRHDTSLFPGSD